MCVTCEATNVKYTTQSVTLVGLFTEECDMFVTLV